MKAKKITDGLNGFEDICKKAGKNPEKYVIPANGSYAQKQDMFMKRLKMVMRFLNGKDKVRIADTNQLKWYPWFDIIEDNECPGGFRLSFLDSGYDRGNSDLGVRPYYLKEEDSDFAGRVLLSEYEGLLQNEAMALLEEEED